MTEEQFQRQVIELAELYRWRVYHTFDSRRSHPGWPDLVLCRAPELLVVELKTDKGRVSAAQAAWLGDLEECGIAVAVWRPRNFEEAHERLKFGRAA